MRAKRKIIEIDEAKCDGCGQCVDACHEGALGLVDGKARLLKDSYCDGLGACLGECPQGAITIIEREAEVFATPTDGCPGSAPRTMQTTPVCAPTNDGFAPPPSLLSHWPVQLMLVPAHAPFLQNADLVVCADCVPFAVPDFHARYLQGRAVIVGCPKLDDLDHYANKLRQIVEQARPRRLTILRMEVPCCRGLTEVTTRAALASEGDCPVEEHVIGVGGGITRNIIRAANAVSSAPVVTRAASAR